MYPLLIGIAALTIGIILLLVSRRQSRLSGLPNGQVIYSDSGAWGKVEKPFFDPGLKLTGKPDCLVQKEGRIIPVEVKSGVTPATPYKSHIYQLAAYCLLVEHKTGKRPPYGIIHYPGRDFVIEYTDQVEQDLLKVMEDIRESDIRGNVARSHNQRQRCLNCGFREACDQNLA